MPETRDADIEDLQRQIDSLTRRVSRISKSEDEDYTWVAILGSIVIILGGGLLLAL
jgi:hypothetical protein